MHSPVTLEEVQFFGAKWVPRLHLQDWQVEFVVEKMESARWGGSCTAEFRRRIARVTIRPDLRKASKDKPIGGGVRSGRVVEAVVVHELVHLYEEPLRFQVTDAIWPDGETEPKSSELFDEYRETMIDSFVRVLLEADAAGAWGTS